MRQRAKCPAQPRFAGEGTMISRNQRGSSESACIATINVSRVPGAAVVAIVRLHAKTLAQRIGVGVAKPSPSAGAGTREAQRASIPPRPSGIDSAPGTRPPHSDEPATGLVEAACSATAQLRTEIQACCGIRATSPPLDCFLRRRCGGTGRRSGFKIRRPLKACRFDSCHRH